MIKIVPSGSFNFTDRPVQALHASSAGYDISRLKKRAAADIFAPFLASFTPPKHQTVVHIIAVGDEETFGPNRNGDAFSESDNRACHHTFRECGHLFRNHRNNDPLKAVGDVIATAHNENMKRIELLVGMDNVKCREEVEEIEKGNDIAYSMGAAQLHDRCSVCGHLAETADLHCDHIKNHLGEVLDDGRQVYMQNPSPKFFDISIVGKPADRIAYMLKKVATGTPVGGHVLAAEWGLSVPKWVKSAEHIRLASIEKRIPAIGRGVTTPTPLPHSVMNSLKKSASALGLDEVLGFLTRSGCMLGPQDFGDLIGVKGCPHCQQASLPDVLQSPVDIPLGNDFASIGLPDSAMNALQSCCGMGAAPVNKRIIIIATAPGIKLAEATTADEQGFHLLYGNYKLAFAKRHESSPTILQNVAATFPR